MRIIDGAFAITSRGRLLLVLLAKTKDAAVMGARARVHRAFWPSLEAREVKTGEIREDREAAA